MNVSGGRLRATSSFDSESKRSYGVRVRTTDAGGLFFEKAFTITVTNVNETPTNLALSNASLAENAGANATVGTFTTTDVDAGDTFTYTLATGTGSTDNASSNNSSGTQPATSSFGFETNRSSCPTRRSSDLGGLFFEKAFTITVTNVNETPTNLALSNASLAENAGANATVGTFTTTDVDAGDTFTYSLVTGDRKSDE